MYSTLNQGYVMLAAFWGGMALGLAYDIFRAAGKAVKAGKVLNIVMDALFWLAATGGVLALIYYANDGEPRAYIFAGMAGGALLYFIGPSVLIRMGIARLAGHFSKIAQKAAGRRTSGKQKEGNFQADVE
ncbi:MAG: spore cortex biosynthesis protein YabQ [Bacillota bacterium]|nr:spore cortex biosynthesis protein YabQ [Bacillota bacterium]